MALKGLHPPLKGHVVVELMDIDNRSIVEIIGDPMVETVVSHDIIGRLMLLAARNPGVNSVYDEVFGFQNDEFYLTEWPELVGRTLPEIALMLPEAVPIGFKRAERRGRPDFAWSKEEEADCEWGHTREGRFLKYGIELNPAPDSVTQKKKCNTIKAQTASGHHTAEGFALKLIRTPSCPPPPFSLPFSPPLPRGLWRRRRLRLRLGR